MTEYDYDYPLYRPPSEAYSLILQITLGCSHNKCTFCSMYKSKRFIIKPLEQVKEEIDFFRAGLRNVKRIFLADGDALIVPMPRLREIFKYLNEKFPETERISIYASPRAALLKKPEELKELHDMGLKLVYLGIESGSDKVLKDVNKGATKQEIIEGGRKIKEAGIPLSVTAVAGLGGKKDSMEHALETADIISKINPDYFSILSLMIDEDTKLYEEYAAGKFVPLSNIEILEEIKNVISHIDVKENCVFRSNHASNYVPLKGVLPHDKKELVETIDYALQTGRLKKEYLRGF